jgi:hypothetical protein
MELGLQMGRNYTVVTGIIKISLYTAECLDTTYLLVS